MAAKWEEIHKTDLFPTLPESLKEKHGIKVLLLRTFGCQAKDLNINFTGTVRPDLTTQILHHCTIGNNGKEIPKDFFWEMALSKRKEALMRIVFLSQTGNLFIPLVCQEKECNQNIEIELKREELTLYSSASENETIEVELCGEVLHLQKLIGKDQIKWLGQEYPNETTAMQDIIRCMLKEDVKRGFRLEGAFTPENLEIINQAIEKFDPMLSFVLNAVCPYCEKVNPYEIDLDDFALKILHGIQKRMLDDIHSLAKHYHWSEREIFSIPSWRRDYYLKLIEKDSRI